MNKKFTSKSHVQNDEFTLSTEETEYTNLINRLKAIKTKITLLEKIIFR